MMKLVVLAVCVVLVVAPLTFGQTNGLIAGVASIDGKPLPNVTVRLRNVDNGQLIGNTVVNAAGEFSFSGLAVGNYVVEMVAMNGTILGTSVGITLSAAAMVSTNISVGASAAALAAAGGTGAAIGTTAAAGTGVAAGAAAGAAGLSATVIAVSAVAVTLGTTAVVAVANDASPSR
jgi:hypothetical protein